MFFLYPKMPALRIVGSDLAHAVPLTLVAGIGHWWFGVIDWSLLGALLVGSLPGIYLGSHMAARVPERRVGVLGHMASNPSILRIAVLVCTGASAWPARGFKGMRLPGQMGNKRRSQLGLEIAGIDADRNLLMIKGSVPGAKNSILEIRTDG